MKQQIFRFIRSPWPHAVFGAANMLFGIVQDSPLNVIVGAFGVALAILAYEDTI